MTKKLLIVLLERNRDHAQLGNTLSLMLVVWRSDEVTTRTYIFYKSITCKNKTIDRNQHSEDSYIIDYFIYQSNWWQSCSLYNIVYLPCHTVTSKTIQLPHSYMLGLFLLITLICTSYIISTIFLKYISQYWPFVLVSSHPDTKSHISAEHLHLIKQSSS